MMHLDRLPNQQPHERVVIFLRAHPFALIKIAIIFLMLLITPILVIFLLWTDVAPLLANAWAGPLLTLLSATYLLVLWMFTFQSFIDYYLDTWIVTNERIINTEQHGLFHRVVSELHLSQIQDVTAELEGVLQSFLVFGDVHIQTAGERTRFEFKDVANPEKVKQNILRLIEEDKRRHHAERQGHEENTRL